jgi:CheY-specific phosphatase CheX
LSRHQFAESTAIKLASALIGERFEALNSDCTDAIGEIVKMIADDAEKGFQMAIRQFLSLKWSLAYRKWITRKIFL